MLTDSVDRVVQLLDDGGGAPPPSEALAEAVDELRHDILDEARRIRRTPSLERALERDSTSARDGDGSQNRAITLVRSIERDLRSLIERESVIKRLFGRGLSDEFRAACERIETLRSSLVANRKAGLRAADAHCRALAREVEALLRLGTGLTDERVTYAAAATLIHGLLFLSIIDR